MANFIYSTLTADNSYPVFKSIEGRQEIEHQIIVKGGANIADKRLFTPMGAVTEVSDRDLELLEQNTCFQMHVKNGFITIQRSKKDVESVVTSGMESRDESAPLVPQDFELNPNEPQLAGSDKKRRK